MLTKSRSAALATHAAAAHLIGERDGTQILPCVAVDAHYARVLAVDAHHPDEAGRLAEHARVPGAMTLERDRLAVERDPAHVGCVVPPPDGFAVLGNGAPQLDPCLAARGG